MTQRVSTVVILALLLMGCVSKRDVFPPLPPVKPALRKPPKLARSFSTIIPTSLPPIVQLIPAPLDNGWWPIVLGPGTNSTGAQSEY